MRKRKYSEEVISSAAAYNETDDQEIIEARKVFRDLVKQFDENIKEEKEKVIAAGGLKIIGTERHESRRIDNQLRGRSGRQGDVGESRFYIGLDDDLMKIFGGDMVTKVYDTLNADENLPIEMKLISNAVENAQKKVEGRNFSIRKHVLSYDDVMNTQREIIYKQRRQVLDGENLKDSILNMLESDVENIIESYTQGIEYTAEVNKEGLLTEIKNTFGIDGLEGLNKKGVDQPELIKELKEKALKLYEQKEQEIGSEELREVERVVMLKVVDQKWMEHIDNMDELKDGIGLRAYGQKDPVVQYRIEGFEMFDEMIVDIKLQVIKLLLHIRKNPNVQRVQTVKITGEGLETMQDKNGVKPTTEKNHTPIVNEGPKINRNDPCPCGSGKKYKNCCGRDK